MESRPKTQPKPKIYLSNAKFGVYIINSPDSICAKVIKDEANQYDIGDNIITLPIIKKCGEHIFESYYSTYIIVDNSL